MATNTSDNSVFNPGVQGVQEPNYLNLSRPIQDLKNYGATGSLLSGVGQIGGDVVKVAHELTQENLDDKVHAGVDSIRDPYSASLGQTLAELRGGPKVTTGVPAADASLLSQSSGTPVPNALKNIEGSAGAIVSAKQDGKISQTDYKMRLDAFTKDLNAQYPGWRDYIAAKVSSVSNEGVADDLIKGRIADINSYLTAAKDEKNKIANKFLENDNINQPGAWEEYLIYKNGGDDKRALQFISRLHADKAEYEHAKTAVDMTELGIKDRSNKAVQVAQQDANNDVNRIITSINKTLGLDADPEKAQAQLATADPDKLVRYQAMVEAKIQQFQLQKAAQWGAPYDPKNPTRSLASDMGGDKVGETIAAAVRPLREYSERIGGKDFKYAAMISKQNEGLHEKTLNTMLNDKDLGPFMLTGSALTKEFGANAMPALINQGLLQGIPEAYNSAIRRMQQKAVAAEPDPKTGKPASLQGDITKVWTDVENNKQVADEDKQPLIAKSAEALFQQIEAIPNRKVPDEAARRLVQRAFSPENYGLLANIENEGLRPDGKKGAYSIYNRLAKDDMTQRIFELGGDEWKTYQEWNRFTVQHDLIAPSIQKLNELQTNPNLKLSWDDRNFRFIDTYGTNINPSGTPKVSVFSGKPLTTPGFNEETGNIETRAFIRHFNEALDKFTKVEGMNQGDVNARVLDMLVKLNYDPTISKPDGISKKLIDAMVATSKANQELQKQLDEKYAK